MDDSCSAVAFIVETFDVEVVTSVTKHWSKRERSAYDIDEVHEQQKNLLRTGVVTCFATSTKAVQMSEIAM